MIIEPGMNLGQLLYLMPDDATYAEADKLRAVLLRDYRGAATQDIPRATWRALVGGIMTDVQPCSYTNRSN